MIKQLNEHQFRIATGASNHSTEAIIVYRQHWQRQGYDLPPFDPEHRPDQTQSQQPRDCGCKRRKEALNKRVSGLGDTVETVFKWTGVKRLVDWWTSSVGVRDTSINDAAEMQD